MPPTLPGWHPSFTLTHFAQDSSNRLHLRTKAAEHREEVAAGEVPALPVPGWAWLFPLPLLLLPPSRLRRAGEEPGWVAEPLPFGRLLLLPLLLLLLLLAAFPWSSSAVFRLVACSAGSSRPLPAGVLSRAPAGGPVPRPVVPPSVFAARSQFCSEAPWEPFPPGAAAVPRAAPRVLP